MGLEDFNNRILIEIVGNGFVVTIPDREIISEDYEEFLIKKEAKKSKLFSEEVQSSSEIEKLQGTDKLIPIDQKNQFKKLSVSDISDKTVLVFQTFPEVLNFLADEFKN